jgi:hypothetical protein
MYNDDDNDDNNNNNAILYWDIITDETVDFNKLGTVFIDRQKKATLMIDIEIPLTPKHFKTRAYKITNYGNLALEIKKLYLEAEQRIYISLSQLSGRSGHQKLPKIYRECRFYTKKNTLKGCKKQYCY